MPRTSSMNTNTKSFLEPIKEVEDRNKMNMSAFNLDDSLLMPVEEAADQA